MNEKIIFLGWDMFFEANREKLGLGVFPAARVIAQYKGVYKIKNEKGEYAAKITGKKMFEATSRADYPAVGDWVAISELDNEQALIRAVLPRKSIIKRRYGDKNRAGEKNEIQIIATNIDVAYVVEAVDRDYSLNRLERYLTIAADGKVTPVVIINKIDLISKEELDQKMVEIKSRLGEVAVILISTKTGEGLEDLERNMEKGKTYCFLGSSGVGKSTIINKLLGRETIKTGDISFYSDRGTHTTTSREMYFLAGGAIVIDNPGVREIGMTDTMSGVEKNFDEITALAKDCKYVDCTHVHEPDCAVREAIESGRLNKEKYLNFITLKKESEHYSMSKVEKKEKSRSFGKFVKKAKKNLKMSGHKYF